MTCVRKFSDIFGRAPNKSPQQCPGHFTAIRTGFFVQSSSIFKEGRVRKMYHCKASRLTSWWSHFLAFIQYFVVHKTLYQPIIIPSASVSGRGSLSSNKHKSWSDLGWEDFVKKNNARRNETDIKVHIK